MKEFFGKNKIFLAIVISALIIGGAIYFSPERVTNPETGGGQTPAKPISGAPEKCLNVPELPDGTLKLATKIIDGDTFLIEGGHSVRILGIDADERGYPCYGTAKNRLEELILDKRVRLEKGKEDLDQYCRYLRYIFLDDKNISLELAREGLAVARFSPEDVEYREEITRAEKEARENKIGCQWSAATEATADKNAIDFQWKKLTPESTSLKVIGACQAGNYLGKEMIVEGKIVDAYRDSKSHTVFLNFEKPYPNQCFTGVIFSSSLQRFVQNPEDYYSDKTVRIRGTVKEYKGRPEIILETPSQIEIGG